MPATALLLTDDSDLSAIVSDTVANVGNLRLEVRSRSEQAECLAEGNPAIVYFHVDHAGPDALPQLLARVGRLASPPPIVAITDDFRPTQAVSLLQMGLADCLSRPLDLGRLAMLSDFLTWQRRQLAPVQAPAPVVTTQEDEFLFWPSDASSIASQIQALAPLDTTVLLTGETGTGKTRLAELLHKHSPRRNSPFVVVNCGTLTPSLAESELFGHVKSAFTGAESQRSGRFTAAADGVILLDDIDALSLDMQATLLRVVDQRCYEPVGSDTTLPLRARILAATNRCLMTEVKAGRFREDLMYRINVVNIHLPKLRERRELIVPLVERWMRKFCNQYNRPIPKLESDAVAALLAYDWPGNIRELRNVVEQTMALCTGGVITARCLPPSFAQVVVEPPPARNPSPAASKLACSRQQAEYAAISQALASNGNNRSKAAAALGISRVTLYKKLRKYGLMLTGELDPADGAA